jgi:hypothetical protein
MITFVDVPLVTFLIFSQAMFVLLTDESWEAKRPPFCLEEFFNLVIELFEAFPNTGWTIATLAWYNQYVSGFRCS